MSINEQETTQEKALEFFGLNARYIIAPGAKPGQLCDDAAVFLDSAEAAVDAVIEGIGDTGSQMAANPQIAVQLLYGVQFQLAMVSSLIHAAQMLETRS